MPRVQALRALDRYDEARDDLRRALAKRPHDLQLREEAVLQRAQVMTAAVATPGEPPDHRTLYQGSIAGVNALASDLRLPHPPSQVRAYQVRSKEMAGRMMATGQTGTDDPAPSAAAVSSAAAPAGVSASAPALRRARAPSLLGSRPRGGLFFNDLDEPVPFDVQGVEDLISRLEASPEEGAAAILAPGGGSAGGGRGAESAEGGLVATEQKFVFGDLNRPGAFVKPRRRRLPGSQQQTGASACECCE